MIENREDSSWIERNKRLSAMTSMGVGGPAQYYAVARSVDDLARSVKWSRAKSLPLWVLSGGTNLVVADEGIAGLVLDLQLRGVNYEVDGNAVLVTVAAGEDWDQFVAEVVGHGYAGIECLSGIPGRAGATPIQNVGAYGQDVSQSIFSVAVFDRETCNVVHVAARDCEFGYRTSRFKQRYFENHVVVSVCYRLQLAPPAVSDHVELNRQLALQGAKLPSVQHVRDAVLSLRRSKSMLLDRQDPWSRGCGSFFVNPVVPYQAAESVRKRFDSEKVPFYPQASGSVKIAAAWLIEKAGFHRGYRAGRVGLSEKHSLALVAHSDATASEVVRLARQIQSAVDEQFGITLVPEPVFWGFGRLRSGLPDIE